MATARSDIEQAIVNNIKAARTLIRLRHSIMADEELNEVIPRIRTLLETQAQTGSVVGLDDDQLKSLLLGTGL